VRATGNPEGFRETLSEERQRESRRAKMAGKKDAKQKADPCDRIEKSKEKSKSKSSKGAKSAPRGSGQGTARGTRQQPLQEQAKESPGRGVRGKRRQAKKAFRNGLKGLSVRSKLWEPRGVPRKSTRGGRHSVLGVLRVSSSLEWTCHMSECQEPYHALRECSVFQSLSTGERRRLWPVKKCGKGHHSLLHRGGVKERADLLGVGEEERALCSSGVVARNPMQRMTQWVSDGGGGSCLCLRILVLVTQENKHFQTQEFLSAEAMGVDLPWRCPSCKNFKECQFWTSAVSYKEDQ
jgi:hypothetical protein